MAHEFRDELYGEHKISDYPEFCKQIAGVMAGYSNIEFRVFACFTLSSEETVDVCVEEFFGHRSLRHKLGSTENAIKRFDSNVLNRVWKRLGKRVERVAKKRTDVAHSVFLTRGDGISIIKRNKASGKFEPTPLKDGWFTDTSKQMKTLANDLAFFKIIIPISKAERIARMNELPTAIGSTGKRTTSEDKEGDSGEKELAEIISRMHIDQEEIHDLLESKPSQLLL